MRPIARLLFFVVILLVRSVTEAQTPPSTVTLPIKDYLALKKLEERGPLTSIEEKLAP